MSITKNSQTVITEEEKEKLEQEIKYLDTVKRLEIAESIKRAVELGDVSENQLYNDLKSQMEMLDIQISDLKNLLKNAKVVKVKNIKGIININDKITVKFIDTGEIDSFQIVGSTNANPLQKKYSSNSPIGQAVLGKKIGEENSYFVGDKETKIKIIGIED
jgi:transcription elongation factor GreA